MKRDATRNVPSRLSGKLPFRMAMLYGSRRFYVAFGLVMAVFFLYGPLPAHAADRNGWRWLLGPIVCPLIALGTHRIAPIRPYSGRSARQDGLQDLDARDADARRLNDLFTGAEAGAFEWRLTLQLIVALEMVMAVLALGFHASLGWELSSRWLVPGILGGALMSWIVIKTALLGWAIDRWWQDAAAEEASTGAR